MPPTVVTVQNAGRVATALSSEKCQRMLDYLSKHDDATETALAKALDMPLSTVHYNMKLLVESKLAVPDTYTYSSRGKEVTHYRANKNPIIIIQGEEQLSLLRAVVPAVLVAAGAAIVYQLTSAANWFAGPMQTGYADARMMESAPMIADAAPDAMMKAAPMMSQAIEPAQATPVSAFVLGAVSVLILSYFILLFFRWRESKE